MSSSLALTRPMGWNSWNTFGHDINETVLRTYNVWTQEDIADFKTELPLTNIRLHETMLLKTTS